MSDSERQRLTAAAESDGYQHTDWTEADSAKKSSATPTAEDKLPIL
ncbi:hypothetical protein KIPB_007133, partial [Kipferlia bialata]|eukprot:g7133.t1